MGKSNRKKVEFLIFILLFLLITALIIFTSGNYVWHSSVSKHIDKIYYKPMSIEGSTNFFINHIE